MSTTRSQLTGVGPSALDDVADRDRGFWEPDAGSPRRNGVTPRLAIVGVMLVISACTTAGTACEEPPSTELSKASGLALELAPNPVTAGSEATLSIERDGLDDSAITGAGAAWQCWTGDEWVDTHQIVKGFSSSGPQTIEVETGVTTTIPAVGLPIPSAYPVLVPDVPAGTYRIADEAIDGGATITGFVMVEVAASDSK